MRRLHAVALFGAIAIATITIPAMAGPFTSVGLIATIAVPSAGPSINPNPGGAFTGFDISYVDPTTGIDYVADRSNAAVDVFAGTSYLGRTASVFAGQIPTSMGGSSVSGPDGVVTVSNGSQHTLFAGDGGLTCPNCSLLRSFNITSPSLPPPTQFPNLNTGGTFRVDEMAYSPTASSPSSKGLVLVANNADSPAFGTLVDAGTGLATHTNITIPAKGSIGAAMGLEQPVWDPATNSFFISVPSFGGGTNPGGVAEIKPDGTIGKEFDFGAAGTGITSCSPTGLALGASGNLMVGCGNAGTQTIVLNPSTGSIVTTFPEISGTDELWYDPTTGAYYVTGSSGSDRVFDIISDSSLAILQTVDLGLPASVGAHSIAVDPFTGAVYLPLPGGTSNTICPLGCVAVFAPEPGSLPVLVVGLAGLMGLAVRRRLH
ncbi:MAG TPA: PEP-CTERM sorting domain-containing protein [Acetobacteraceae bacterium]|nr:PEP-CTERM sorting domain-containing protein [Acetobacteraceae bacterium]